MSERKDEKWLDNQLQKTVDGSTPVFDAEAWKQKHAQEYQTLLARGGQTVGQAVPSPVKVRSAGGSGKRSLSPQSRCIAIGKGSHRRKKAGGDPNPLRSLPMVLAHVPRAIGKLLLPLPPSRSSTAWIGKLAVAAAIAVAVGLFVLSRSGQESGGPIESAGTVAQASPAKMMSMLSLRMAYQRGGFEALDRQLQDTLDEFRPRSSSVPVRELF